jgi:hypothetical protein
MTPDATISLNEIDAALAGAAPKLSVEERRLAVGIYRLLAAGEPVPVDQAAACADIPADEADRIVRSWPAVFRDEQDGIVGFGGLALRPMAHRLRVADTDLYAWCAWDPFFLALIIGSLDVTTNDPTTDEAITYRIGPDATITDLSHPDSVLSFLRPDQPWDDKVMPTFCHFVLQFAGPESADNWIADHPGTFVISLDDAVQLALRHVSRTFSPALRPHDSPLS